MNSITDYTRSLWIISSWRSLTTRSCVAAVTFEEMLRKLALEHEADVTMLQSFGIRRASDLLALEPEDVQEMVQMLSLLWPLALVHARNRRARALCSCSSTDARIDPFSFPRATNIHVHAQKRTCRWQQAGCPS